ncbi:MAG: family 20 glycosylhydrolase [candidate division WS1 bacterium]|jgi:hypothetical protein|nr:family 20 glycosylhydrolase [candidate division WS1 bacterium]
MRITAILILLLTLTATVCAQRPLQHVLFDFEDGIDDWTVNVWGGGGTVTLSLADDPKFGSGALHSLVAGVERGGNSIGPWVPAGGEWRDYTWGVISLWFRGDGTPTRASLRVNCGEGEEITESFSYNLPMDSTEWRRFAIPTAAFWNREGLRMDASRIVRLYIGHSGDHEYSVDQIAVEADQRPVPLTKREGEVPVEPELLQFGDGRYGLRFDPSPLLPGPASARAQFTLPGGAFESNEQFAGAAAEGDALLLCPAAVESGAATLSLTVARGQDEASATWTFDAVANRPLPDPTRLSLLPAPKEIELGEGAFALPNTLDIEGAGEEAELATNLLPQELGLTGANVSFAVPGDGGPLHVRLGAGADAPADALARLNDLPAGGYLLDVGTDGATIRANDAEGLRNGALTIIQTAESHFALTGERAIPEMHVIDWPNLPIRAVSLALPSGRWGHPNDAPADPDLFIDFLRRTMLHTKMNVAVITIHQAMQYDTHPQVSGPAAWPKEEVKRVFDTLRSWGVEPVPLMNSLGHMNWLCIPYRDLGLAEDGDVHEICTSHPDAERIVKEIYQEIIDLVQPRYFHLGLDEIRWHTESVPEEQRCPRCAGLSKQDIFVDWVTMLRDFIAEQGMEPMMWGDMILPGHNGGPPYNLAETVDRLPKDIIITNWSTRVMPDSHKWLLDQGFERIVKSNSRGATLAEQQLVVGNMFGCWYKVPWLVEGTSDNLEGNAYGSFLEAAEYSWNHWTDMFDMMPPLTAEFFAERPLVQWRVGSSPVAAGELTQIALPAATPVDGLPDGPVNYGHLAFDVNGAISLAGGEEATLAVGEQAEALYFLHATRLLDREALVEALKVSEHWDGVPIGEYVVTYASGATETIPVRYSMELRDPEDGWCNAPIVYNSIGVHPMTCEAEGLHLYAMQWRNPRPDDAIASVTLRGTDAPATLSVAGMARR